MGRLTFALGPFELVIISAFSRIDKSALLRFPYWTIVERGPLQRQRGDRRIAIAVVPVESNLISRCEIRLDDI
jgi:hypothetical protein